MAIFATKRKEETELGFGTKNYGKGVRFIGKNGKVNIRRTGLGGWANWDGYYWLISTSLFNLIAVILLGYTIVNTLFAFIYYAIGAENFGGIAYTCVTEKFLGLFFFSAQTLTTVGYGHIHPIGTAASTAAAFESLLGLMGFALATGVLYGRFSRPKADLLYSNNALIAPYQSITALMFRVVNIKQYELIETEAQIVLSINNLETNRRDFLQLPLERSKINFLTLSWTIVHPIDDKSPVYGLTVKDLVERDAEMIILIKGINDTQSQLVYSRHSYKADSMLENVKFVPLKQDVDVLGRVIIDVKEVHSIERLAIPVKNP
jgi:inward rectifier potassium channel